jgi:V8-like Glu-specific endopeptidase
LSLAGVTFKAVARQVPVFSLFFPLGFWYLEGLVGPSTTGRTMPTLLRSAHFPLLLTLAFGFLNGAAVAQDTLQAPMGREIAYALDSGKVDSTQGREGREWTTAYAKTIVLPGAHWLRLHFDVATLNDGSYLLVTSTRDGESHRLDAAALRNWKNSTAYLNGDTLLLQLIAAPGSKDNRVVISRIEAELPSGPTSPTTRGDSAQCGICTLDDRTQTSATWSGRIMPVGCSGTIICEDSTMISAGHCVGANQVMQFNVPNSNGSCGTLNPPVSDQFPVAVVSSVNGGVGNDWAVYTSSTNDANQKPFQRYGQLRRLTRTPAVVGNATNIYGFGLDTTCTRSQTQQLSPGTITVVGAAHYSYNNDVRGGNSGSGFLFGNKVIGVVTHCSGCGGNIATRIEVAAFANAINSVMMCDETVSVSFAGLGTAPAITITPEDTRADAGGVVPFTRTFLPSTHISATAPATANSLFLKGWRLNDVDMGPNPVLTMSVNATSTAQAHYRSTNCTADRDNGSGTGVADGGVDVSDLLYFLDRFGAGAVAADLDNGSQAGAPDGAVDVNDLVYFLVRFEAGC